MRDDYMVKETAIETSKSPFSLSHQPRVSPLLKALTGGNPLLTTQLQMDITLRPMIDRAVGGLRGPLEIPGLPLVSRVPEHEEGCLG